MTHVDTAAATAGLATASHHGKEGSQGATFVSLNGVIMRDYCARYGVPHAAFAPFAVTAHANALTAAHATLKIAVTPESYEASKVINSPIQLMDASPICDGAAAVVLTSSHIVAAGAHGRGPVRIAGSSASTDALAVEDRPDILRLPAVTRATETALALAGLSRDDIDIFELHDAYTIMACVSLESAGFAPYGQSTAWAKEGHIGLQGSLPIATFGGLKARGHPVGATGVYQAAEMHRQLTQRGGANQVEGARTALTQNVGGSGASIFMMALTT
jgi:acetyl-CoA C-acetyltransferase